MVPRVSVVMPVYNVAPHIEATITSVLAQTFTDFELLVLDDCSTDGTATIVQAMRDPRIRFLQNPHNLGRAGTDNAALPHVRGEFIAKMDGDDLCHPERLAKQVAYLDQHPEVDIVGSFLQNFGASTYLNRYPVAPELARARTLFTMPVANPTVMLRTSLLREERMQYNAQLRQTEDYDFFARYIDKLRIANIPEPLVQYRVPQAETKVVILTERSSVADDVRARVLNSWGLAYDTREWQLHNAISMLDNALCSVQLAEVEAWLTKLMDFNSRKPLFEPEALRRELGERWYEVCYARVQPRLQSVRQYRKSKLAAYYVPTAWQQAKMWLKAMRSFY